MKISPQVIRRFLPNKVRMIFYESMAAQMKNGMNILAALTLLRQRVPKGAWMKESLLDIAAERIRSGATLGQALKGCIPDMEYMIIAASDSTSNQFNSLLVVVEINKKRASIIKSIWTTLGYSIFLYLLFFVLLLVVAFFVVPTFLDLVPLAYWQDKSLTLYHMSSFITSYIGLSLIVTLILMGALAMYSLPRWTGTGRALAENIPPWSLYRLIVSSTWLLSISSMIQGNISTTEALAICRKSSASPWLNKHLEIINSHYAAGYDLGQSVIYAKGFLEKDVSEEMALYTALPNFAQKLPQLTQHWLDMKIAMVQKFSRGLNMFGIVSVLALIVFVVFAVQELIGLVPGGFNLQFF